MRDTPTAYRERTARAYRPPPWIRALAPPLEPDQRAPTLFRYPCPAGLRDFRQGQLKRLAGRGYSGPLFLSDAIEAIDTAGHEHFGVLVVLDPLRYNPCPLDDPERPHHWVGENRPITDDPNILHLPPELSLEDWDAIREPAQAIDALGGPRLYDEALRHTWEGLTRYLEERRARLERAGVEPLWTPR